MITSAVVVLLTCTLPAAPAVLPIADFGDGIRTAQGGLFCVMGAHPDQFSDRLAMLGDPPRGAWRIEAAADAPQNGIAAAVPLFDNSGEKSQAPLLNISTATHLHARMIGELGGRKVVVEIIPGRVFEPDVRGIAVGTLTGTDVQAEKWQDVIWTLPAGEDALRQAGAIRFSLEGAGAGWIAIGSMALSQGATPPSVSHPAEPAPPRSLRRAMWVWTTDAILADAKQVDQLLAFSKAQQLTDLFCQMYYDFADGQVTLRQRTELRAFNAAARKAGIGIHALDGHPQYVLKENHPRMLALVEAIARFNEEAPVEARFCGVHLDNEPYVMNERWSDAGKRQALLQDYLELNGALGPRVRSAGMEYGVDIPFWWDRIDDGGAAAFTVDTPTGKAPLLEALFPLMQNVGIMSYRERVTGANGVVACCAGEFALGARLGVAVFASIETGVGERYEKGTTFGPYSNAYFVGQFETLMRVLPQEKGCAGLAIHPYDHFQHLLEKRP